MAPRNCDLTWVDASNGHIPTGAIQVIIYSCYVDIVVMLMIKMMIQITFIMDASNGHIPTGAIQVIINVTSTYFVFSGWVQ